jgi:hypothetical protein
VVLLYVESVTELYTVTFNGETPFRETVNKLHMDVLRRWATLYLSYGWTAMEGFQKV